MRINFEIIRNIEFWKKHWNFFNRNRKNTILFIADIINWKSYLNQQYIKPYTKINNEIYQVLEQNF